LSELRIQSCDISLHVLSSTTRIQRTKQKRKENQRRKKKKKRSQRLKILWIRYEKLAKNLQLVPN
jgi:hypothetical protein